MIMLSRLTKFLSSIVMLTCLGCHQAPHTALDFADDYPDKLSEWRLVNSDGERLTLNSGVVPYDLNSALFSDYALKLRGVLVPDGTSIRAGEEDYEFPLGTVITKTFYYARAGAQTSETIPVVKTTTQLQGDTIDLTRYRLLETRLLINTAKGWEALPYVWNEEQTEATLELAGAAFNLELVSGETRTPFTYLVPDVNQCTACHAVNHHQQQLKPIGLKTRHLNKTYQYTATAANQLLHWKSIGLLHDAPSPNPASKNASWDDPTSGTMDARARAYLDVNCSHCHNPAGSANTSGLLLHPQESSPAKIGICKIPIATGRGSGNARFDIVPGKPEDSIFLHRMASTEPDVAMPELGRSLVHEEGVALIREWIAGMSGACEADDRVANGI